MEFDGCGHERPKHGDCVNVRRINPSQVRWLNCSPYHCHLTLQDANPVASQYKKALESQ